MFLLCYTWYHDYYVWASWQSCIHSRMISRWWTISRWWDFVQKSAKSHETLMDCNPYSILRFLMESLRWIFVDNLVSIFYIKISLILNVDFLIILYFSKSTIKVGIQTLSHQFVVCCIQYHAVFNMNYTFHYIFVLILCNFFNVNKL